MQSRLALFAVAVSLFLLSGCYTQLQYSGYAGNSPDEGNSPIRVDGAAGNYRLYYRDYEAASWYARHGFGHYTWPYPYYSPFRYGWLGFTGIGFSLWHDWYRDRYFYTPS